MKKTILFFSRAELTHFYALLSLKLQDHFDIINVAYSLLEQDMLKKLYGIKADYVYQDLVHENLVKPIDIDLLNEIDSLIVKQSKGRFTLNSSIQSDRGFCLLSYDEALLLSQSQFLAWDNIFTENNIKFFYHEPPSLFMNHIASLLCLENNANYCYDSMVKGEYENNFILLLQDTAYSPELEYYLMSLTEDDVLNEKNRILNFIEEFRTTNAVFLGDKIGGSPSFIKPLFSAFKFFIYNEFKSKKLSSIKDNIDYFLSKNNTSWNTFKNLLFYKLRIKFENFDEKKSYYYYSMNLEPEATVLYLGDGLYENQVKLIVNIAAQLPPNTFLYVKDHPHFIGYRDYKDYLKLMNVPNIKLLKAKIPGKSIIKSSKGVFIVNGTAGFEAIMLNKPVFTFGNMFYNVSDRVTYVKNIKDLRNILYSNREFKYKDDVHLYKFVLAFLKSTHIGVTDYFQGRIDLYNISKEDNADYIAKDLVRFFNNY